MAFIFCLTILVEMTFQIKTTYLYILGKSLECISCSSEKDKQCADLLEFNYTSSGSASIQLIDCSDEAVRRQFIEYFSNLLSVLGVPVESSAKGNRQVSKNEEKPQACQKVVLNRK